MTATILPDGSAFFVGSLPLPKDHWLYAPQCAEWDNVRDTSADTPHPILDNSHRAAVTAAIRYAVRGATMCGQEADFDPDALVQNACYALCGPAGGAVLPCDAPRARPLGDSQPVAWIDNVTLEELTKNRIGAIAYHRWLAVGAADHFAGRTIPLYASPQRVPDTPMPQEKPCS